MTNSRLGRLARMDAAEIAWRGKAGLRTVVDRARARLAQPRWSRADLLPALTPGPEFSALRRALAASRWDEAQRMLAQRFASAPQRFALSLTSKDRLVARIREQFPAAARDAATVADRILAGEYDLLGYRGLRFDSRIEPGGPASSGMPDWHLDPVHQSRAPRAFWSTVPYLDPACGDHKIIWELNRHQHWLSLGRAYWLTGTASYRSRFIAELESWMEANPPLVGVNWASMLELGFRAISWVWALNLFAEADADDASPWLVDLLAGLDRQLRHIELNLSHYFSPNTHLLGEALALYVAGHALPELAASDRRIALGRRILLQEIDRQIGADGGHSERSTHYHRYALDFYSLALIVARQAGDHAAARFEDAVTRLGYAARLLADDTGRVPHIGDDDGGMLTPIAGRAPDDVRDSLAIAAALVNHPELLIDDTPEEALWLLGPQSTIRNPQSAIPNPQSAIRNPQWSSSALPETGYYVSRSTAGDHLVIDGGPHGYQNGGHAHADALSLTFAIRGVPLLIDPGTACYTTDAALRDRMRSTPLHNTLTLGRRSQSTPSGPFHWSRVANGCVHRWCVHEQFDYFDGSQDGYHPDLHRRRVLALHGDLVVVADFVAGAGGRAAAVHWHLDPRWRVDLHARGAVFTRDGDRVGLSVPPGLVERFDGDADSGLGWCSPAYGRLDRTTTIRVSHAGTAPFWMMSVFDLDRDNPVEEVDWVPVWADAGALAHSAAIRITRASSIDHVLFAEPGTGGTAGDVERPVPGSGSASPARSAVSSSVRVGDVETDARMLCYRSTLNHPAQCLAIVDGTFRRGTKGQDQGQDLDQGPRTKDQGLSRCAVSRVL